MDGVVKFWDLRMHLSSRDGSCLPPAKLLKTVRGGHSHWITRASYNPFYDQLVLSGGTDGIANLWRVSSCSSAPLLDFADDDDVNNSAEDANDGDEDEGDGNWAVEQEAGSPTDPTDDAQRGEEKKDVTSVKPSSNDTRVSRYECTDTTADVCWSASDPWMYASLACDGTLAVHHVPSKEKYKILL
jgi:WD40 repeat protein